MGEPLFKRVILKILMGISVFVIITLLGSVIAFSPQYMYRIVRYGESDVKDYKIFPERIIKASQSPMIYEKALGNLEHHVIEYLENGQNRTTDFNDYMENTGTTAFIVVHNDKLIHEGYYNGHTRESINTSFSSVKSIVTMLIGIAIEEGHISSEKDSIAKYIPELKNSDFENITIEDLLLMRSPIKYREGYLWFGDDAKTYYMPDLRNLAINSIKIDAKYDGGFLYNNYHPLLLGIILERSTGESVSSFLERTLWRKIGTEFDASWSLDSHKTGFEKMESGLNYRTIDFVKIGSLLLNEGRWDDEQIISNEWLEKSIFAHFPLDSNDYKRYPYMLNSGIGYQYMWYSIENTKGGYDFFAQGKYGQYLYISPENNVVIARNGFKVVNCGVWPLVLRDIADDIGK